MPMDANALARPHMDRRARRRALAIQADLAMPICLRSDFFSSVVDCRLPPPRPAT